MKECPVSIYTTQKSTTPQHYGTTTVTVKHSERHTLDVDAEKAPHQGATTTVFQFAHRLASSLSALLLGFALLLHWLV